MSNETYNKGNIIKGTILYFTGYIVLIITEEDS